MPELLTSVHSEVSNGPGMTVTRGVVAALMEWLLQLTPEHIASMCDGQTYWKREPEHYDCNYAISNSKSTAGAGLKALGMSLAARSPSRYLTVSK